jgi:hypothetical protein
LSLARVRCKIPRDIIPAMPMPHDLFPDHRTDDEAAVSAVRK